MGGFTILLAFNMLGGSPAVAASVYGGRFVAGHVYRPGMQKAVVANTGFAAGSGYTPGFQHAGAK